MTAVDSQPDKEHTMPNGSGLDLDPKEFEYQEREHGSAWRANTIGIIADTSFCLSGIHTMRCNLGGNGR